MWSIGCSIRVVEAVLSATPSLHLRTMYRFDEAGRIVSTLEPQPAIGPSFTLIRGRSERVWAVGARVAPDLAKELDALATQERPLDDWREPPRFAERYRALLGGELVAGQALEFSDQIDAPTGVILIDDASLLTCHFQGWTPEEIARSHADGCRPLGRPSGEPVRLCAAHRRGGGSASGDGGAVSRAGVGGSGDGCLGDCGEGVGSVAAVQHVLGESGVAVGGAQAGAIDLCRELEPLRAVLQ